MILPLPHSYALEDNLHSSEADGFACPAASSAADCVQGPYIQAGAQCRSNQEFSVALYSCLGAL